MSNKLNSTAPVAIFLKVSSEPGDCYSPFPSDTRDVSWCADRQGGAEVRYIRADLAAAAAASLDAGVEATIAQLEAQLEEERARNAADQLDVARWRGLLGCARIRPLGSAGLENPEPGFYAHMGLEVWTTFSRNYSPKLLTELDQQNELGRRWLTQLADVAIQAAVPPLAITPGADPK